MIQTIFVTHLHLPLYVRLMQLFGFAYLGPFGHFFHMLLDKVFKGKRDPKTVAKKVS